jgi:hypothetical protein
VEEGMTAKPFLLATGFALLCSGWVQAASIPPTPPSFEITLGAWDADELFDVTANSTYNRSEEDGYTQNSFCPSGDWEKCVCNDPQARLSVPADATDFDGSASFYTDSDGGAAEGYINIGPNIETVLMTTTITPAQENEIYTCSSNEFLFCGFKVVDPNGNEQLDILFTDPRNPGGIPSATPEPRQYALLLIALGALIVAHRIRSQRASA